MPSDPPPAPERSEAERLFVEHALASDGPLDVEGLSRAHPELAEELAALHRRWARALGGSSLIQRLRQRHGQGIALDLSLEERAAAGAQRAAPRRAPSAETSAAAGPSSSVFARLAGQRDAAGRYRVGEEIARGGMGAILEVWDEDLRRTLAMKVALVGERGDEPDSAADAADSRLLNRFLEEAQITGQLDHPGVVPVHELGLDADGRVYFTMRLVKGRDLKTIFELVRRGAEGWTVTRALGVMLKVCEAMAFAHEKGVVHRDLKPANVMVGRFGETYVMDWGLARVLGREDSHDVRLRPDASRSIVRTDRADDRTPDSPLVTMDGDIVGTPCYMAPEQARGRLEDIGPHSDVYAAGSMLYHLLTGRMPYVGEDERAAPTAVLGALLAGPPAPIRALDRRVPDELAAICEKAMAREPRERYATMLAMAEDLRAYLEDRVVKAHASGPVAELRKWFRRNRPAALAGAAALLLALLSLAAVVLVQARSNRRLLEANDATAQARDAAVESERVALAAKGDLERANVALAAARDEADATARQARLSEYAANIAAADSSLRLADPSDALRRLELCDPGLRGWEWLQLELASDPSVRDLGAADERVARVAFAPDGERVATASSDDVLRLYRVEDGALERSFPLGEGVPSFLAFTPDGARVAWCGQDRAVHLWDVATGAEAQVFGAHDKPVTALAFSPDGALAATGSTDKRVRLWELPGGALLRELEGHGGVVTSLAFSRSGELLASGSRDRSVRVWTVPGGAPLQVLAGAEHPVSFVDFDPSGLRVAAGFAALDGLIGESVARGSNTVRVWDVADGALRGLFSGPQQRLSAGGFSPDGRWLFAASDDSTTWLWDLRTGRERVLLGHRGAVLDAAFAPDGRLLVSCAAGGEVKLWSPELQLGFELRGHVNPVSVVAFSDDGARLLTASADGAIRTWSPQSGLVQSVLRGHASVITDLAVLPGERLASASSDGTTRLWDRSSGRELARLGEVQVTGPIPSAVLSQGVAGHPDGRRLAVARAAGSVVIWDPDSGETRDVYTPEEGEYCHLLRWSPDGALLGLVARRLVPARITLHVWDERGGALAASRELPARITDLAFQPDGRALAVASGGEIRLLDPRTLELQRELHGGESSVGALAFTHDGRRLASGAADGSIRVRDVESGEVLLSLPSPGAEVTDLAFDPQDAQLAAGYSDWSAFLWSTRPTAQREAARRAARAERRQVLPLLDALFERFADPDQVVERLSVDPGLEVERLRVAARLARLVATDPRDADREGWRVVLLPGQPDEELHRALWSAQVAARAAPDDDRVQRLLGAALYRLGRLPEARAALERARELRKGRDRVEVVAFLAMVYHRLGDEPAAQRAWGELRTLMQVPVNLLQRENHALTGEAEEVLALPPDR